MTVLFATVSVAGCGWFRGDSPLLGVLDEAGLCRALAGTWSCTDVFLGDGIDPLDYEVTFEPAASGGTSGRYMTKSEGSGEWSIREFVLEPSGEYSVQITMKDDLGQPGTKDPVAGTAGKTAKLSNYPPGEWDVKSMSRQSFVRNANGVLLKYRRKS